LELSRSEHRLSIDEFIRVIQGLPEDEPVDDPRVWYRTQKEHWLGWLREYDGPGAYGRRIGIARDARFAYNHIVNHQMLVWLAQASGVSPDLTEAAIAECVAAPTLQQKSAIVRRHVPWSLVVEALRRRSDDLRNER
jgi:hypothetical protein